MFSMNSNYYDLLFAEFKRYVQLYSLYSPTVLKKPMTASPKYPQVILAEISNSNDFITVDRRQVIDTIGYEIDIFSTNLVVEGATVDNLVICRELAHITDAFMFEQGFRRLSKTPTPTVDTTLYRIVSRYTARMFNNYNQIL